MLPKSLPAEKSKIFNDTAPVRVKNGALNPPLSGHA
jgi:hypothetical protein